MRYRLRTLLIVLALGPPVLAGAWFESSKLLTASKNPSIRLAVKVSPDQGMPLPPGKIDPLADDPRRDARCD